MGTTGMYVLLVCLCTVLPGQSTDASQDEYVEGLSEKEEREATAVGPPRTPVLSLNTKDPSSSLSLGKIRFSSIICFIFTIQKVKQS